MGQRYHGLGMVNVGREGCLDHPYFSVLQQSTLESTLESLEASSTSSVLGILVEDDCR